MACGRSLSSAVRSSGWTTTRRRPVPRWPSGTKPSPGCVNASPKPRGCSRRCAQDDSARVTLAGADPQPDATGTLVYNRETRGVVMLARGFTPAPSGETYQLWLVTEDDRKVSVGTFEVAPNGLVTLTATLDADPGTAVVTAVTNEPVGGSAQPTGQFQMLGEF